MQHDDPKRCSRWILRVMEWDEPKARYPNLWHDGLPSRLLLLQRAARRLRLGDLVAAYYPQSQQHPQRSEKFVGLVRVTALNPARQPGHAWVDLEAAHRFAKPLAVDPAPHRVFLCCDPGWPGPEVDLFRRVFAAAVAEGFKPDPDELEGAGRSSVPSAPSSQPSPAPSVAAAATPDHVPPTKPGSGRAGSPQPAGAGNGDRGKPPRKATQKAKPGPEAAPERLPKPGERVFAGVDYNGDMRDPRDRTWLAVLALADERLRVVRLRPSGRSGVHAALRDPDRGLLRAEAVGLDFPFGLPQGFGESLLDGAFPEEGWWALVKRLEGMTRPTFLEAVHEYREAHGEVKRFTDQAAQALSPLHRGKRDLSPMTYHGLRMIAEDRSRFAVRPFETAQASLLLEVNPQVSARKLPAVEGAGKNRAALLQRLKAAEFLPVDLEPAFERHCLDRNAALDAVFCARAAAVAVVTGEAARTPEELAPGEEDRIRLEGWIYGAARPAAS